MAEMTFEEMNDEIREEIYNDVIQEFDYIHGYCLTGDQKQTIVSDIVEYILTERQNQPHCECAAYGGTN